MLDTTTSRDKPSAASQAANTSRMIGKMLVRVEFIVRIISVISTNRDSTRPSKHNSDDIRCDRYISRPKKDVVNAIIIFK